MKDRKKRENCAVPIPPQPQHGSTLVSAMIGVGIIGAVGVGGNFLYTDYRMNQETKNTAATFDQAMKTAITYAQKNQSQILSNSGVVAPTIESLVAQGYAPAGFNPSANDALNLQVRIAKEPASCAGDACVIGIRVFQAGGITRDGKPDPRKAARIVDAMPSGLGWKSTPGAPTVVMRAGVSLPNPLGSNTASVVAATWIGTNKAATTVPPVSYQYRTRSCPPGYYGSIQQERSVITDKWGNVSYGSWNTYSDDCEEPPPPPEPVPSPPPAATPPPVTSSPPPAAPPPSLPPIPSGGTPTPEAPAPTPAPAPPPVVDTPPPAPVPNPPSSPPPVFPPAAPPAEPPPPPPRNPPRGGGGCGSNYINVNGDTVYKDCN